MTFNVSSILKLSTVHSPTAVSSAAMTAMNSCRGWSLSSQLRSLMLLQRQQQITQSQQHDISRRFMGHTVRIILTQDVSDGKLYTGDIATVKAGFARNYLIPQKKAVYATRQNFLKLNMKDPQLETAEERQTRLDREAIAGDDKDLKSSDILRSYLSNKVLKIWRTVDTATGTGFNSIKPGMVDAKAIRRKLNKQLKIKLEPHERVHIYSEEVDFDEMTPKEITELITNDQLFGVEDRDKSSTTEIKTLGQYVARICLRGGFTVPLKLEVMKR